MSAAASVPSQNVTVTALEDADYVAAMTTVRLTSAALSLTNDVAVTSPDNDMPPFPSNGSDGAFAPSVDTVLPPRLYQFTTINIPANVTVTTTGNATLELRAQGAVTIAGTIDVSGAPGRIGQIDNGGGGGATDADDGARHRLVRLAGDEGDGGAARGRRRTTARATAGSEGQGGQQRHRTGKLHQGRS